MEERAWFNPNLNREMTLKIYGHRGKPFIVFPCSRGRYFDCDGHIHQMEQAIAEGAKEVSGAEVEMRRVPETLTRTLHEAFYCERRKREIFGSILEVRTRMYSSTIRPQTSRINFALRARTFRTSTALATKFRAICGLTGHGFLERFE